MHKGCSFHYLHPARAGVEEGDGDRINMRHPIRGLNSVAIDNIPNSQEAAWVSETCVSPTHHTALGMVEPCMPSSHCWGSI